MHRSILPPPRTNTAPPSTATPRVPLPANHLGNRALLAVVQRNGPGVSPTGLPGAGPRVPIQVGGRLVGSGTVIPTTPNPPATLRTVPGPLVVNGNPAPPGTVVRIPRPPLPRPVPVRPVGGHWAVALGMLILIAAEAAVSYYLTRPARSPHGSVILPPAPGRTPLRDPFTGTPLGLPGTSGLRRIREPARPGRWQDPAIHPSDEIRQAGDDPATDPQSLVDRMVPGLYDSIDPDSPSIDGLLLDDTVDTHHRHRGRNVCRIRTGVTDSRTSATGEVTIGIDELTGDGFVFSLRLTHLRRWVHTDPPMVPGRGTPLSTYLQLRLTHLLHRETGIAPRQYGDRRTITAVRIEHPETVLHLARAELRKEDLNKALRIAPIRNAVVNPPTQLGYRIGDARLVPNTGTRVPASRFPAELLERFEVPPTFQVRYGFDVEIDTVRVARP